MRSDNGCHLANKHLQQVERSLGPFHKSGASYHPQSQGNVERMNGILKARTANIQAMAKCTWLEAWPITLRNIRMSVCHTSGLSPFELSHGTLCRTVGSWTETLWKNRPGRHHRTGKKWSNSVPPVEPKNRSWRQTRWWSRSRTSLHQSLQEEVGGAKVTGTLYRDCQNNTGSQSQQQMVSPPTRQTHVKRKQKKQRRKETRTGESTDEDREYLRYSKVWNKGSKKLDCGHPGLRVTWNIDYCEPHYSIQPLSQESFTCKNTTTEPIC